MQSATASPSRDVLCEFDSASLSCKYCGFIAPVIGVVRNCPGVLPTTAAASFSGGPGTELSRLLKRFGIEPTPTCQCRAKSAQMDAWGADECEKPERIEEVVAVMREEARARGLPFLDAAGRLLVRRAIKLARRKNDLDKK